jgi:hypothetical protein
LFVEVVAAEGPSPTVSQHRRLVMEMQQLAFARAGQFVALFVELRLVFVEVDAGSLWVCFESF